MLQHAYFAIKGGNRTFAAIVTKSGCVDKFTFCNSSASGCFWTGGHWPDGFLGVQQTVIFRVNCINARQDIIFHCV